jgi:hypothetical protein
MTPLSPFCRHLSFAVVFALVLLALPGCVPGITWLPDSSGFVYVEQVKAKAPKEQPIRQLMHYDIKQKASRVIVADIASGTSWPAVSPDGKRIAVSRFNGNAKDGMTIQFTVFDFQGKQVKQSKAFPWSMPGEPVANQAMLFWSPRDDMVVVSDGEKGSTGIYSMQADSLQVLPKTFPVIHGGSPIRPDGKGFLAVSLAKDNTRLGFFDWQGKAEQIDFTNLEALMPKTKRHPAEEAGRALILAPMLLVTGWEENRAFVGSKRHQLYSIDTGKRTIAVFEPFEALLKGKKVDKGDIVEGFLLAAPITFDFPGDGSIRVVRVSKANTMKVIKVDGKTGKEETLLEEPDDKFFMLPASPDGNFMSMWIDVTDANPAHILLLTSKGVHSKVTWRGP